RVAQVGRLVVHPTVRGKLLLPVLLRGGFEFLVGEASVDLAFVDCLPGIVSHYRRLGALPYGGRLIALGYGQGIPLVLIPSDLERLERLRSPVGHVARKYFGPGKRPRLDLAPFRHLLEGSALPVEFAPDLVWNEVERCLLPDGAAAPAIMAGLRAESRR